MNKFPYSIAQTKFLEFICLFYSFPGRFLVRQIFYDAMSNEIKLKENNIMNKGEEIKRI